MNFFVRKILGKYFTSEQWANFIVKETAESSRKVFEDFYFQEVARMKGVDAEENNRIFNEVQVTGIVFSIMFAEQKRKFLKEDRADFWKKVVEKIPEAFYIWLRELKLDSEHVGIWKDMINHRINEYQEGMIEMKKLYEKEEMENVKENIRELFYCLDAVALGGALHITRGKMSPDDLLRKRMLTWLGALQIDLAKKIR